MAEKNVGFNIFSKQMGRRSGYTVSVDGGEGTGKTSFGLTAEGNNFVMDIDGRMENAGSHFGPDIWDSKKIYTYPVEMPSAKFGGMVITKQITRAEADKEKEENLEMFYPIYTKLRQEVGRALRDDSIKTYQLDTATEIWDLFRIANLGRFTDIPAHLYASTNMAYTSFIKELQNAGKNVILLHKVKDEYVWVNDKSVKTGGYVRDGFSKTGFLADVLCSIKWDYEKKWPVLTVNVCKPNRALDGIQLKGELCTWEYLIGKIEGK